MSGPLAGFSVKGCFDMRYRLVEQVKLLRRLEVSEPESTFTFLEAS